MNVRRFLLLFVAMVSTTSMSVAFASPTKITKHDPPIRSGFTTIRSSIVVPGSKIVYGVPENQLGAPVALVSCNVVFRGKPGSIHYGMTVQFTALNETNDKLRYTRIAFRIDRGGAYSSSVLLDMKPHEMRTFGFGAHDGATAGDVPMYYKDYPHWMLCSAGPAVKADGTTLDFEPPFLHQ